MEKIDLWKFKCRRWNREAPSKFSDHFEHCYRRGKKNPDRKLTTAEAARKLELYRAYNEGVHWALRNQ